MDAQNNRVKFSSWRHSAMWSSLLICIAVIAGTYNNIFSYAAFVMSIVAIVVLSEEDALCLMMFLMPFANIFKVDAGAQSFFTYLMLVYVLWRLIKIRHMHKTVVLSLLFLLIFLVAQMLISINLLRTIKFASNLLFIYFAISLNSNSNHRKIYLFYIGGIVVSSLIAALNVIPNLSDYISKESPWYSYAQIERFTGMYGDPNYFSTNLIITLCLVVILQHNKQISAVPAMVLAVLVFLFAGLTASKSAFLMLILPLALLLYSRVKKKNYFLLVCLAAALLIFVAKVLSGEIAVFNITLARFDAATDLNGLTTGRIGLWLSYLSFLSENPRHLLLGGGFGAGILGTKAAHNTYIDLLYYLGILGTVLCAGVFCALANIRKRTMKPNMLNYSIWLCIGPMYFFLSQLFYFDWAFHITLAILVLRMNMNPA